ncbi:kinetochore Sim4 complex subunit FTA2-domain-containing protein [Xylaria digitata]|nr:kinetochore Sim4 complex subunit FTA2-domain-containing protein [Xylaria digitata]
MKLCEIPKSAADLVPLPQCDGPKLKPFAFQVPPKIKFLDYLGEDLHSHVFKVQISGQIYAFCCIGTWSGPLPRDWSPENIHALYGYSEPFSCECRAFGRLHETGYEELAIRYKGGRPPPLRGIVKEFGSTQEDLQIGGVRKILRDATRLHQLGIIDLDVAHRQLINGKLGDFSTAITTPHVITTPELNRYLPPESIRAMNYETFRLSKDDYYDIEVMVLEWNDKRENQEDYITFCVFESGNYNQSRYQLRSIPSQNRVYSFVDPRWYDWKVFATCTENDGKGAWSGQKLRRRGKGSSRGGVTSRTCPRLDAQPPRWYFDCNEKVAKRLRESPTHYNSLECDLKDGFIFPRLKKGAAPWR